jgi:hypothetical protein
MNTNFLKTYAGVVFVMSAIMTLIFVVTAMTSGYSCGGKKEMYEKKAPIPEDKMRRIEAKRKRMRERQKKIYR